MIRMRDREVIVAWVIIIIIIILKRLGCADRWQQFDWWLGVFQENLENV